MNVINKCLEYVSGGRSGKTAQLEMDTKNVDLSVFDDKQLQQLKAKFRSNNGYYDDEEFQEFLVKAKDEIENPKLSVKERFRLKRLEEMKNKKS